MIFTDFAVELLLLLVALHLYFGNLISPFLLLISVLVDGVKTIQKAEDEIEQTAVSRDIATVAVTEKDVQYKSKFEYPTGVIKGVEELEVPSPNCALYIKEQQKCCQKYMSNPSILDLKSKLLDELHIMDEALGCQMDSPFQKGHIYFYITKNNECGYTLHATESLLNNKGRIIFDSSKVLLNNEIDKVELGGFWISNDGKKLVYTYTLPGATSCTYLRVRDVSTGIESEGDHLTLQNNNINHVNIVWLDNVSFRGFFYTSNVAAMIPGSHSSVVTKHRVYFHALGTTQFDDVIVRESIEDNVYYLHITPDTRYLVIEVFQTKHIERILKREVAPNYGDVTNSFGNKVYYIDISEIKMYYKEFRLYMDQNISGTHTGVSCQMACVKLIDSFDYRFQYITSIEIDFWFRTNYGAPKFRVILVTLPEITSSHLGILNLSKPLVDIAIPVKFILDSVNTKEWIPMAKDGGILVCGMIAAHTVLVLKYLRENSHEILIFDLSQSVDGTPAAPVAELPHPPYGTIATISCSFYSFDIFYKFNNFSDAGSIWRAIITRDSMSGSIEISFDLFWNEINLRLSDELEYKLEAYDTRREVYKSADSTPVPILLFGKREVLDAPLPNQPCILYAVGGFGISITPTFSSTFLIWAQQYNGIIAIAGIRGGGDNGKSWHYAGVNKNRSTAVSDVISATEYLFENEFATKASLTLLGEGPAGVVMLDAVNKRPFLFQSVVFNSGVFDTFRYHHYNSSITNDCSADQMTLGTSSLDSIDNWSDFSSIDNEKHFAITNSWYREYGCSEDSPYEQERSRAACPLTNINHDLIVEYPAMLLIADRSNQVVSPVHSMKLIYQLQNSIISTTHNNTKQVPFILDYRESLSPGKNEMDKHATILAFLCNFITPQQQ